MRKSGTFLFLTFFIASFQSWADQRQDAFCTCMGAQTILFLGAAEGKTPRDYGIDIDVPLLVWRDVIAQWNSKLKAQASKCAFGEAKETNVGECRQLMKKYPDGKF